MKILFLANNDVGLYKFRRELLEKLIEEKYEVVLSLPNGAFIGKLREIGCSYCQTEFSRRGMNPARDLHLMIEYCKMIRREKPDIVLSYTIKPNVYGGMACRLTKTPYIANITGLGTSIENPGLLQKLVLLLYKIGLRKSSCVFFQNAPNLDFFIKKGVLSEKSVTQVIPGSGVNLKDHFFVEYPKEDEVRFLFIGRIMKDKGIEELMYTAEKIRSENTTDKRIRFLLIGECDEDYSSQLEDMEKKGVLEYLKFQKDVHSFIANCHCTILPSYHEGMANVLLESAACGRPVIATLVTGCRETFDDGISGLGCEARNAESLYEAVKLFLCGTEKEHAQMGLAGRAKMERQYDRNIVINTYIEEINKVKKV